MGELKPVRNGVALQIKPLDPLSGHSAHTWGLSAPLEPRHVLGGAQGAGESEAIAQAMRLEVATAGAQPRGSGGQGLGRAGGRGRAKEGGKGPPGSPHC